MSKISRVALALEICIIYKLFRRLSMSQLFRFSFNPYVKAKLYPYVNSDTQCLQYILQKDAAAVKQRVHRGRHITVKLRRGRDDRWCRSVHGAN